MKIHTTHENFIPDFVLFNLINNKNIWARGECKLGKIRKVKDPNNDLKCEKIIK